MVPQTLSGHPGSTQPGGTATDAGSRPTAGQKAASSQGCCPTALVPPPPDPCNLTELLTIFSSKGCQLTSRTQALWLVSFFTMWPLRRSYTVRGRPEWRGAVRVPSKRPAQFLSRTASCLSGNCPAFAGEQSPHQRML